VALKRTQHPSKQMTKAQARAYVDRWRLVNQHEIRELRAMTLEEKLRVAAQLHEVGKHIGWNGHRERGVAEVRQRWQRLRRTYGV
jgi:exopolyphosphatase/pppGpp-phosphohydrolase